MKKLNLNWVKIHWSKIVITLCTLFIVIATSYTLYNYIAPITPENTSKELSTNKNKTYNEENDLKNTIEPFNLSSNDIEKEVSSSSTNIDINDSDKKTIEYKVKSNDTLFSICKRYMPYVDTTKAVSIIKDLNKIGNDNILRTGQVITIPTYDSPKAENPNITDNVNTLTYTVKQGDTLFSIAKHYMSWCDSREGVVQILELNNIKDASLIKTGQELMIPCNGN